MLVPGLKFGNLFLAGAVVLHLNMRLASQRFETGNFSGVRRRARGVAWV